MASGTTLSSDFFDRQTLADTISAVFARQPIFFGSPAVIVRDDLPSRIRGKLMTIPYFASIGDFQKVDEDQALTIKKLSDSGETAAIQRAGIAVEISHLAEMIGKNNSDPYEEFAAQIREAAKRFIDLELMRVALTTDLIYTAGVGAGASTPSSKLTWVEALKASLLWTDDGQTEPVLLGVHSKVYTDLLSAVDSQGRPLLVDAPVDGKLSMIAGIPTKRSNRLPVDTVSNPNQYTSIIARANSMAFWYQPPVPKNDSDILVDSDVIAVNMYYIPYLYKRVNDNDQKGVVKVISQ